MTSIEQMTLAEKMEAGSDASRAYLAELQAWCGAEQEPERGRLAADLRSKDNRALYAAALELYLGNYIRGHGWEFERHPEIADARSRPDFLVHHPAGGFYVEAAVIMDSDADQVQSKLHDALREALRPVVGPFYAIMTVLTPSVSGSFSRKGVREFLERNIKRLGAQGRQQPMSITYRGPANTELLEIRFDLYPASTVGPVLEDDAVLAAEITTGPMAVEVVTHESILGKVHQKVGHYGELGIPYVLALQLRTDMPPTAFALDRAIYGDRQPVSGRERGQYRGYRRARNGVFGSVDTEGEPIRTRLSAILFYNQAILPGEDHSRHEAVVFHNTCSAQHPLSLDVFADLPQRVSEVLSLGGSHVGWLGTPPAWAAR